MGLQRFISWIVIFIFALHLPVLAVQPDEILDNPVLEKRARDISSHLRCLVCQNESIDDSNAPLARDIRLLVRERLVEGDTDKQVLNFMVERYGEFVLLKPRLNRETFLLWGAPVIIIGVAFSIIVWRVKRRNSQKRAPLTEDEEKKLENLLRR
ncbi:cytochrome c-type biogenesis protein [Bartonella tamiae]|uniref:Cytochrome c-type biogenesis protein n=1 Tax=Bartonella tamiae Th239 TaxID=1094558 RepID=J1K0M6_9HYPH|nr:cytochrome c-type biogenesis protein [Bartonella tamiae]EJF90585.1 hypothetical protein ME5_00986 [Bartonella tamiae Th239]EJF94037.1 hypothetical protein MEG_00895 [Bartonella tamiae Th307]